VGAGERRGLFRTGKTLARYQGWQD
jgi:hypothetical protein